MSFGGKADSLLKLQAVAEVPHFVVLEGEVVRSLIECAGLKEHLLSHSTLIKLRPPFAVRSSADNEDGATASYAGMYESILGVATEDLPAAVELVASSGSADRVGVYQADAHVTREPTVSVIIQEMVDARASGVLFTRAPQNGEHLLVEAVLGVGQSQVDGTAVPDSFEVRRSDLVIVASKRGRQFVSTMVTGERTRLPSRMVRAPKIAASEVLQLARSALAIEEMYSSFHASDRGVDIEWAIDSAGPKFLQCRPITTAAA